MSTTTLIAKSSPSSNAALSRISSMDADGSLVIDETIEKSIYTPVIITSQYELDQYHDQVKKECFLLQSAFPASSGSESERSQLSAFYTLLYATIESNRIPIDRLHDSIINLISTHKYKSFNIANVIEYDKKIVLSPNKDALSRKLRRPIHNIELAITYEIVDSRVVRLFGLIDDLMKFPAMKDRILATWDETSHGWNWTGQVDDPSMPARQKEFKTSLYQFCKHPGYPGAYEPDVVRSFYEYFSEVMPPGDKMRWEIQLQFDSAVWLESWNKKHSKSNNNGTTEDTNSS